MRARAARGAVFAIELIGGLALLPGIHARRAALALVPVMAVAARVHLPNGWAHICPGARSSGVAST